MLGKVGELDTQKMSFEQRSVKQSVMNALNEAKEKKRIGKCWLRPVLRRGQRTTAVRINNSPTVYEPSSDKHCSGSRGQLRLSCDPVPCPALPPQRHQPRTLPAVGLWKPQGVRFPLPSSELKYRLCFCRQYISLSSLPLDQESRG